jgi:hypothetical protein
MFSLYDRPWVDQEGFKLCNSLQFSFNYRGGGVESSWVQSALQPLIGLLCQSRVIMMEKLVEWLAGETEVFGENLPQCRFVDHKTRMPARKRTRAAAVGSQRLTAWPMTRPLQCSLLHHPVTSVPYLNSDTFFIILFFNFLSLYETRIIIVLYILFPRFLDTKCKKKYIYISKECLRLTL